MLKIKDLSATADGKEILAGLSLEIAKGELHAVMGPNGSGKSTLAHVLAGHPGYQVTGGKVTLFGKDLLEMEPEERAAAGLFLGFQYPASLPGVSVTQFIRLALQAQQKARGEKLVDIAGFIRELRERMKLLNIPLEFAERSVNDGFSGGERKRLEILQMLMLKPKLVILDEIDSGLDIDALKLVAEAVKTIRQELPETSFLVITHYQRLLTHLPPDVVHIVQAGKIQVTGGHEIVEKLEAEGYKTFSHGAL